MIDLLAALAALAVLIGQWWISSAPARRLRRRRRRNVAIHNDVARHDIAAIRDRLKRLRAEGY